MALDCQTYRRLVETEGLDADPKPDDVYDEMDAHHERCTACQQWLSVAVPPPKS